MWNEAEVNHALRVRYKLAKPVVTREDKRARTVLRTLWARFPLEIRTEANRLFLARVTPPPL